MAVEGQRDADDPGRGSEGHEAQGPPGLTPGWADFTERSPRVTNGWLDARAGAREAFSTPLRAVRWTRPSGDVH